MEEDMADVEELMGQFREHFRAQCMRFCEAAATELESLRGVLEREDDVHDLELAAEALKEKVDWLWSEASAFRTIMEIGEPEEEGDTEV